MSSAKRIELVRAWGKASERWHKARWYDVLGACRGNPSKVSDDAFVKADNALNDARKAIEDYDAQAKKKGASDELPPLQQTNPGQGHGQAPSGPRKH